MRKLNVMDGQTDGRTDGHTGGVAISPGPTAPAGDNNKQRQHKSALYKVVGAVAVKKHD